VALTLTAGSGTSAATVPAAAASAAQSSTPAAAPRPSIIKDFIPYSAARKRQMAAYSWRHYHQRTWLMPDPKAIILHYTVSPNYPSVHNWFSANSPAPGNAGTRNESPGACVHFVVDKNGKIYQQVPLGLMCRQVIGINNRSIGIEFVEMSSAANILNRPRQVQAGLALVRWLQSQFSIATSDVIGHSMANQSRYFVDYEGWRNDHVDWSKSQVKVFRARLLLG
jgi:hypothetical protein